MLLVKQYKLINFVSRSLCLQNNFEVSDNKAKCGEHNGCSQAYELLPCLMRDP